MNFLPMISGFSGGGIRTAFNFIALLLAFSVIVFLAVYYFYVLSLYRDRNVSEAYEDYFIHRKIRFWNRYQNLYVIPGRIYNTVSERPSFFGRENVTPPEKDSSGLEIRDLVPLRFKLYSCSGSYSLKLRVFNDRPGRLGFQAGKQFYDAVLEIPGVNEVLFPVPAEEMFCVPGDTLEMFLRTQHPVKVLSVGVVK